MCFTNVLYILDGYEVINNDKADTILRQTDPQTEARGKNIHARIIVLVHDTSSECALQSMKFR